MSEIKRRLPEIGEYVRGQGTLVEIQNVLPCPAPPIYKDYIFEKISARVELRLGNEVLVEVCTLWDAYGLETSVKSAIEEAKEYASKRRIGPGSELEVVVIKMVEQVRERPQDRENFYSPGHYPFEALQVGSRENLPDPVKTVVWSSREKSK